MIQKSFFRSHRVHVIPHGNFIDVFPNNITRENARRKLEVDQSKFVFFFFGDGNPYQGLDNLIHSFSRVNQEDAILLLMLKPGATDIVERALNEIHQETRVRVFTSQFYDNSGFQTFLNASDVAVLPFEDIQMSGTAITDLSFGKPLILPRIGCLTDLIDANMGNNI